MADRAHDERTLVVLMNGVVLGEALPGRLVDAVRDTARRSIEAIA